MQRRERRPVTTPDRPTARQIALINCADAIEADCANGAEYIFQHPVTKEPLPQRTTEAVERHMKVIAARLRARSGG